MMGSDRSLLLIFLILRNAGIVAIDGVTAGQAPISLDIAPSLPYLVAIITEKANLVKARDAKARVLVRPTKGGMLVQETGRPIRTRQPHCRRGKGQCGFFAFCFPIGDP